ncbi:MAG: arylamine N-acetyltransferase [Deltaproteobacteria bacterium]|nr:arylamine N-acetyltransferase [Deltaproteobacteria bacterium]
MDNSVFPLDAYLTRLNYSGSVQPTEDRLEVLHRAQAYAIPFENFDILLGRGITLDPPALWNKLIHHARGGYCFELNGVFLMALQALGFEARALLARVHLVDPPTGRGHQLLLVTMQGKQWIADVGFGGPGLRAPIPFELNRVATHDGQSFRLVDAGPYGIMLQTQTNAEWQNLYSFDLGQVFPNDIVYGNYFTSTHPSSFFTFARVAALPTPNGRVSLFNHTLRILSPDGEHVQELREGQPYLDALKTHFGIELNVPHEAIRPLLATSRAMS